MSACMCVDYLAHEWDSNDIIQANHEIKKQLLQVKKKQLACSDKEQKSLHIEHDRLVRYQNALWRQMAKICTSQLGRSNKMVNPSSVNWQKESDITWLYGPLYTAKNNNRKPTIELPPTPPPEGIKSVLKKPASSLSSSGTPSSLLSSSALSSSLFLNLNDRRRYHYDDYRPWSKTCSEPGAPISVRFNPDIEKLEYLPESPVRETMAANSDYWSLLEEDDEDDEDDILWSMVLHLGQFITKQSTQLVSSFLYPGPLRQRQKQRHHRQQAASTIINNDIARDSPIHVLVLFFSMSKSLASLIATWLMYQSLLPFTWFISYSQKKHHHHTTASF